MFQGLILRLLPVLLANVTPEIKKVGQQYVSDLRKKAATTPNPFDDMLVDLLDELLAD